jgi:hypothetical protein
MPATPREVRVDKLGKTNDNQQTAAESELVLVGEDASPVATSHEPLAWEKEHNADRGNNHEPERGDEYPDGVEGPERSDYCNGYEKPRAQTNSSPDGVEALGKDERGTEQPNDQCSVNERKGLGLCAADEHYHRNHPKQWLEQTCVGGIPVKHCEEAGGGEKLGCAPWAPQRTDAKARVPSRCSGRFGQAHRI